MSQDPSHESLPSELRELFDSERRAPGAPAGTKGRVFERLATSVALAPLPAAPATAPLWHSVHLAAVAAAFVVGAGAGVGAMLALHRGETREVPRMEVGRPTPSAIPSSVSPPAPWSTVAPVVAPALPTASSRPTSPTPAAVPSASSIGIEQAILDTARVALGREDAVAALAATDAHARRFPHGQLAEEREAIAIQALVLLHRDVDAKARAAAFVRTYPGSALLPAIQAALESAQ